MNDDETNESNEAGKETDTNSEAGKKSPAQTKKEENDLMEKEIEREEDLKARAQVGGKANAGQEEVKETEDEKWAREAKVRYAGTGMDPTDSDGT